MKLSLRPPEDPFKPMFDRLDTKIPLINPPSATKRIMSGAFGQTYLHIDAETKKKYAVKVIDLTKPSINAGELIKNEIENYYDISHKCPDYFCQFIGYHYDNNILTIVMDYCGMDFFEYYAHMLADNKTSLRKKFAMLKSIFTQIAEALQCLHQHGYVHFDVKPENITVQKNPNNNKIKVKLIDAGSLTKYSTNPVRVQGTLDYMAPELKHAYLPKYLQKTKKNLPSSSVTPGYVSNADLGGTDIYSYGKMVQAYYPTLFDDDFMRELTHPLPFRRPSLPEILNKLRGSSSSSSSSGGRRRRHTKKSRQP